MSHDPVRERSKQLGAWFLGPKAENAELSERMIHYILDDYFHWRRNYFPSDEILIPQSLRRESVEWEDRLSQQVAEMLAGLRRHFPFYSPRYIAHMLSDQTIPSVLGYFAGMLYNPNNVTPEAAPVTVKWEFEVAADILRMVGYKAPPEGESREEFGWAHVTGGGTVANLEALWAARNIRYFPLAVRDVCARHSIPLAVNRAPIAGHSLEQCTGLRPSQSIYLYPRFLDAVRHRWNLTRKEAATRGLELLAESEFSLPHHGARACYNARPPAIFVAGTRHYSISKTADLLGFGRASVIQVDVDAMFRMDTGDLRAKLERAVRDGMLPLAVVAIAGTTEEGAVDPIHRIAALRGEVEATIGQSFWLHVDAAWAGYICSIFRGDALQDVNEFASRTLVIERGRYEKHVHMKWGYQDVCQAFLAFPQAESVTIDPHKMGYVPYPCGVAAFRNDLVRQFLTEEAPYISEVTPEAVQAHHHRAPETIGPYILEGSKPGAAVAACWLSHRMIPPDRSGYGEIIRASLLTARELYERLVHWETAARVNGADPSCRFIPVTDMPPDTNIVCFVVQAVGNRSISHMNKLNHLIYERFTIEPGEREYSYHQPFFLSRTTFRHTHYPLRAVRGLLDRAGVDAEEYEREGLFILRATVMTPYIMLAAETGHKQELLVEFMERLAEIAQRATGQAAQPAP
jgi:glutamate/tyrosine decarboxylase-like PLP-dependent enzyme